MSAFEAVIFSVATVFSVVAFLSCVVLYRYSKYQVDLTRSGGLRCLYQYGLVFFAGTALLCVNWMIGDRAPMPMRPLVDEQQRVGFAAVLLIWALTIVSTFLLQRMLRVIRRPAATPEGRTLMKARVAHGQGRLHGGRLTAAIHSLAE
jgi:hypothetical protein